MITIEGTNYRQAQDLPIVAYAPGRYIWISHNNSVQRLDIDTFSRSSHDHDGEIIRPASIMSDNAPFWIRQENSASYLQLWVAPGTSSLTLFPTMGIIYAGSRIVGRWTEAGLSIGGNNLVASPNRFVLPNNSDECGLAFAWNTYPCDIRLKTDIHDISDPFAILERVKGIDFLQAGDRRMGISAQDLEASGIPGACTKNASGQYTSVNETKLIPVLLQAVKSLESRVRALEGGAR